LHLDISNNNLVSDSPLVKLKDADSTYQVGDFVDYGGKQCPVLEVGDKGYIVSNLGGIIAVADAIVDMGALSSANLLGNYIPVEQAQELVKIMQAKEKLTTLCGLSKEETELDFSDQNLGAGDAVLIANDISDMGAISSVNLLRNDGIPIEQAQELVKIMQSKEKLTTLCGLSKEETELDFSGQYLGAGDAVLIANDISGMEAMTSLSLESNDLGVEGVKIIADVLPTCT
jgi:ribosomal protein L7Ae-like RNA K-turn-binding protein